MDYIPTLRVDFMHFLCDTNQLNPIRKVWMDLVPSKVCYLGWKVLLNRVPTKEALERINPLPPNHNVLCPCSTSSHIFELPVCFECVGWLLPLAWCPANTTNLLFIAFCVSWFFEIRKEGGEILENVVVSDYLVHLANAK
ncbi:hypothetical protein RIF29_27256 [Crotalaria pallida]|uniref:Reverse transcriptase zinc-binding domain-containing protein n=1 Tax=Crotalaria pallida TaxID=3830 RepID=A0AAN9ENR5_CROPI